MDKKSRIKAGLAEALPLAVAIAAYGLSYGVLAIQANLSVAEAVAMSLLVFSGSVQMVAVAMLMAGAGLTSIFFSSLLLNLRNLLYGAALAEGLAPAKRGRWLLAFGVSDEPFVLGSARFKRHGPDPLYFGTVVVLFYAAWAFSSFLGAFAGNQLDPQKWGLDLAFPVTFTALLLPVLKEKPVIATAAAAAIIALLLEYLRPGNELTINLAGVSAPGVGLYIQRRKQRHA
ncbi:MAG: AzlC family ABC transporter permease [Planifilum fimeticola]